MASTSSLVSRDLSHVLFVHRLTLQHRPIDPMMPFYVRRQNVIRPMGVRPDGTLAPLEETLRVPEDHLGSDSD